MHITREGLVLKSGPSTEPDAGEDTIGRGRRVLAYIAEQESYGLRFRAYIPGLGYLFDNTEDDGK